VGEVAKIERKKMLAVYYTPWEGGFLGWGEKKKIKRRKNES